ncbi:tRNA intron endonuclease [Absidia repens]|uniref:tRNA-intron lyase n=1 Tax=Absidia repens TaxID=90262 RepID=A0A1X2ITU3_9FUNG|nr:tRNA intron endonuclease [Absidia repens]
MADEVIKKQLIRIRLCGKKPLVFDVEDVKRLRCDHQIVGSLVGSLPRFPQQNGFYGLPLLLLAEEVSLIVEKEWGTLTALGGQTSWDYPKTRQEWLRYMVYCHFHQLGYFLTSGEKFGGDYLAYPGDPMRYHSHYIIAAHERQQIFSPMELVAMGRLATNTKKTFVLASPYTDDDDDYVDKERGTDNIENSGLADHQVECFSITWAGF